jgi:hypothetical protein
MKPKWICCCLVATLFSLSGYGQKSKVKFNSLNMFGVAAGESRPSGLFQTINGVRYNNWFAGIGAGLDYYSYRTIPVFFDLRRDIGKLNKGFIYADVGYNFPWKEKPGKEISFYNSYHFTRGLYSDIGIGYKVNLNENPSFLFSAGYSYKRVHNKIGIVDPCLVPPCSEKFTNYEYGFGRIVLKAGIVLR